VAAFCNGRRRRAGTHTRELYLRRHRRSRDSRSVCELPLWPVPDLHPLVCVLPPPCLQLRQVVDPSITVLTSALVGMLHGFREAHPEVMSAPVGTQAAAESADATSLPASRTVMQHHAHGGQRNAGVTSSVDGVGSSGSLSTVSAGGIAGALQHNGLDVLPFAQDLALRKPILEAAVNAAIAARGQASMQVQACARIRGDELEKYASHQRYTILAGQAHSRTTPHANAGALPRCPISAERLEQLLRTGYVNTRTRILHNQASNSSDTHAACCSARLE
jgi:hypothetical protein